VTEAGAVAVDARPAAPDDLDVITELAVAARAPLAGVRGGPVLLATDPRAGDERRQLAAAVKDEDRLLLVGTIDRVVVGYLLAAVTPTPAGWPLAAVEELFVEPDARQVGVGAAVLDRALAWAVDRGSRGIDAVALPGDRVTKNFFESHGLVARAIIAHRSLTGDREPRS
jgi:GNAT superfamily N-acetyltransferase